MQNNNNVDSLKLEKPIERGSMTDIEYLEYLKYFWANHFPEEAENLKNIDNGKTPIDRGNMTDEVYTEYLQNFYSVHYPISTTKKAEDNTIFRYEGGPEIDFNVSPSSVKNTTSDNEISFNIDPSTVNNQSPSDDNDLVKGVEVKSFTPDNSVLKGIISTAQFVAKGYKSLIDHVEKAKERILSAVNPYFEDDMYYENSTAEMGKAR